MVEARDVTSVGIIVVVQIFNFVEEHTSEPLALLSKFVHCLRGDCGFSQEAVHGVFLECLIIGVFSERGDGRMTSRWSRIADECVGGGGGAVGGSCGRRCCRWRSRARRCSWSLLFGVFSACLSSHEDVCGFGIGEACGEEGVTVFGSDGSVRVDEGEFVADLLHAIVTGERSVVELLDGVESDVLGDVDKGVAVSDLSGDLHTTTDAVEADVVAGVFGDVVEKAFGFSVEVPIFVDTEGDQLLVVAGDACTVFVVLFSGAFVEDMVGFSVDVGVASGADLGDVDVASFGLEVEFAFCDLDTVRADADVGAGTTRDLGVAAAARTPLLVGRPFSFRDVVLAARASDEANIAGFVGIDCEVKFVKDLEKLLLDVSVTSTDIVTGDLGAVGGVEEEVDVALEDLFAAVARAAESVGGVESVCEPIDQAEAAEGHLHAPGRVGHDDGGVAEEESGTFA